MSLAWAVVATILATIFLAILGFLIRFILRLILRPKITIRHTIEPIEVSKSEQAPAKEKTLAKFGDFSVWIKSSETIHIDRITFKRLCRYQDNCLLFDFFSKVGAIQNRIWCPMANVDTLKNDPRGLEKPAEQEEEAIKQAMFHTGEFSYRLTNKVLQKGVWINIDAPFHLLKELYHIMQIRLDYQVILPDEAKGIRFLNNFLERIYRIRDNAQFSELKRVGVEFIGNNNKASTNSVKEDREPKPSDSVVIGTAYHGLKKIEEINKIISDLQEHINAFLIKHTPSDVVELSTQELRDSIEKEIPTIESMGFTQPPNGKYRTLPKDAWEDLLPCLYIAGDFCKRFMNCANYAQLSSCFVQYFALLPYLLKDSYSYLVVTNHNPFVDILINLKLRTKGLFPTLIRTIKLELEFMVKFHRIKRELRQRHNKLIKYNKEIRDGKTHKYDF